ncbi:MAG TPA: ATP-binding protein [Gammaproteobacteria bacterium]
MARRTGNSKDPLLRRILLGVGLASCLLVSATASVWVLKHVDVDSNLSAYQANNARALLVANLDGIENTLHAYRASPDEIKAIELIGWVNATRLQARDMLKAPGADWSVGEQQTIAQLERDLGTFLDETGLNPLRLLENLENRAKRSRMEKVFAGFSAEKVQLTNQMVAINTENLGRVAQDYRQIAQVQRIALAAITTVGLLVAVLLYFIYRQTLLADRLRDSESDLRRSNDEALRADRAKDEFLAASSHELRTPLAAIVGNIDLLKERHASLQADATVGAIDSSIRALLYTVNDLLDLSRSGSGSLAVDPRPGSVAELVVAVGTEFRSACEKAGLRLETQVDRGIALAHLFDPDRLRQVLYNLLSNALKFTEHGSITLGAGLAPVQPADASVIEFYVADTGIGIAPADIGRIFEPYVRVDNRRDGSVGTGLGLALTTRLVSAMGGKLQVSSEPEVGSRFYFTLQLPHAAAPAGVVTEPVREPVAAETAPPVRDDGAPPEGATERLPVLVAEDDEGLRDVITGLLEIWGYQVEAVQNGTEAVAAATTRGYGLVLSDIQMPKMDGYALARTLRQMAGYERVPIVAMSGAITREERQRCIDSGMDECLLKPVVGSDLKRCVQRHYPPAGARSTGETAQR